MIAVLRSFLHVLKDIYHYVRFPQAFIAYRGVYQSFDEALAARPKHVARGIKYDCAKLPSIESICLEFESKIKIADTEYPLFFYLLQILSYTPNARICDFGGGFGRHYLSFFSNLVPDLCKTLSLKEWQICELQPVVQLGNKVAERICASKLHFGTTPNVDSEIFIASSSFQYIENFFTFLAPIIAGGGGRKLTKF